MLNLQRNVSNQAENNKGRSPNQGFGLFYLRVPSYSTMAECFDKRPAAVL